MIDGECHLDRLIFNGDSAAAETLKDSFAAPVGVTLAGTTAYAYEVQLSFLLSPKKKGQKPNLQFRFADVQLPPGKQ